MSTTTTTLLEDHDPDCLSPAAARALLADAPWRRLAVVGDSVAAGVREATPGYRDRSFADRIADALPDDDRRTPLVNLGEPHLRAREIREQQLAHALAARPDLVVVSAGGNDALGRRFDADALRDELRALLTPLVASGALTVTIGLYDLPRTGLLPAPQAATMAERFDALDALTIELGRELGVVHVDTHHHPRAADPAIFAADRIHANARGHAIAAAEILRAVAAHARSATGDGIDRS